MSIGTLGLCLIPSQSMPVSGSPASQRATVNPACPQQISIAAIFWLFFSQCARTRTRLSDCAVLGGVAVAADSGQRKPKLRSRHRRHPTHHGDTKESSCSHRSSTAGTATLPTGSGTRGSCLLDGPSPPTSRSRSPPRTRGDYPPLTTTSPPSDGAHGLSTMTRACPARRARADAHGSSVSGHLFASLPPCKTAGSYTQT